jgi:hypothetical protein
VLERFFASPRSRGSRRHRQRHRRWIGRLITRCRYSDKSKFAAAITTAEYHPRGTMPGPALVVIATAFSLGLLSQPEPRSLSRVKPVRAA